MNILISLFVLGLVVWIAGIVFTFGMAAIGLIINAIVGGVLYIYRTMTRKY